MTADQVRVRGSPSIANVGVQWRVGQPGARTGVWLAASTGVFLAAGRAGIALAACRALTLLGEKQFV